MISNFTIWYCINKVLTRMIKCITGLVLMRV